MKQIIQNTLAVCASVAALLGSARADIIERSTNITADERWTRDNVYVLTGIVYILPPAKLTIEPGTLIRGAIDGFTVGINNPGTIAACRGAKIIGNGTVDDPIIFTCLEDNKVPGGAKTIPLTANSNTVSTTLNFNVDGPQGNNAFAQSARDGGVYLMGRSIVAYDGDNRAIDPNGGANHSGLLTWTDGTPDVFAGDTLDLPSGIASPNIAATVQLENGDGVGFALIEGLPFVAATLATAFDADGPTGVVTGAGSIAASTTFNPNVYGGVDPDDDSGVLRFWSIRYGGFTLSSGIEVNGLTLGGVGRNTVVEFMEVAQNSDDSIEIFGGTVNGKYLAHLFSSDDGFDGDLGYNGSLQNLLGISDNETYIRTGFSTSDSPTLGRTTSGAERSIEWDGPEGDNLGATPDTDAYLVNASLIGNRGNNLAFTDPGIGPRRGAASLFTRMIVEDISATMWAHGNAGTAPYGTTSDFTDSLYFNVAAVGATAGTNVGHAGLISTIAGAAISNVSLASATQLRGKGHATKNGLDFRQIANTAGAEGRDVSFAAIPTRAGVTDFFTPTRWHGGARDNNWLFGWTWTHQVELMPTTNLARPVVTLSVSGTNPTISFTAVDLSASNDFVYYSVERSVNGTDWVSVGLVNDGSAVNAPTKTLADSNATSLAITVTDTAATVGSSAVHYRVIAQ